MNKVLGVFLMLSCLLMLHLQHVATTPMTGSIGWAWVLSAMATFIVGLVVFIIPVSDK